MISRIYTYKFINYYRQISNTTKNNTINRNYCNNEECTCLFFHYEYFNFHIKKQFYLNKVNNPLSSVKVIEKQEYLKIYFFYCFLTFG